MELDFKNAAIDVGYPKGFWQRPILFHSFHRNNPNLTWFLEGVARLDGGASPFPAQQVRIHDKTYTAYAKIQPQRLALSDFAGSLVAQFLGAPYAPEFLVQFPATMTYDQLTDLNKIRLTEEEIAWYRKEKSPSRRSELGTISLDLSPVDPMYPNRKKYPSFSSRYALASVIALNDPKKNARLLVALVVMAADDCVPTNFSFAKDVGVYAYDCGAYHRPDGQLYKDHGESEIFMLAKHADKKELNLALRRVNALSDARIKKIVDYVLVAAGIKDIKTGEVTHKTMADLLTAPMRRGRDNAAYKIAHILCPYDDPRDYFDQDIAAHIEACRRARLAPNLPGSALGTNQPG